ncbi:MAG: aryl-sulfate sulfotransferase [Chloroflexota bacterium]|nr:aryl-sulfate sulfotransferase [Chloroflexota bacterium]
MFRSVRLSYAAPFTILILSSAVAFVACGSVTPTNNVRVGTLGGAITSTAHVLDSNALIARISGQVPVSGTVYIQYWFDGGQILKSPASDIFAASYSVHIVRLRPETRYNYKVSLMDDSGAIHISKQGSFTSGRLPAALANATFDVVQGKSSYPITFLDFRQKFFHGLVAIDSDGHIVWYYQAREGHEPYVMDQRENGNIVYLDGGIGVVSNGIAEITPLGVEVARLVDSCPPYGPIHHEVKLLPDGRVIYLSRVIHEWSDGTVTIPQEGDTLGVWDPDTGNNEIVWNIFDHVSPKDRTFPDSDTTLPEQFMWGGCDRNETVQDWSHGNSIHVNQDGTVLVSFRHLDQVIKLSEDFKEVIWRLGGPGGEFIFLDPQDRFYHQHSAIELHNGNVLLFDNGNGRSAKEGGEYSRSLELDLDLDEFTVTKVWEYRHSPDIFSDCCSNVTKLDTGNYLMVFGMTGEDICCRRFLIVEADDKEKVRWMVEHKFPGKFSQYRVFGSKSIMGEVESQ